MKLSMLVLSAAAGLSSAHNTFPYLIADNTVSGEWEYVRRTANKWSHGPVTDVTSAQIRCYEESGRPAADVKGVTAGSTVGFKLQAPIQHIGPVQFYMARVPDGQDVDSWEASGNVFFKIKEVGPKVNADGSWSWPTDGNTKVFVDLPSSLPDGNYLLRVEQIALHAASNVGGAQFYLACGQVSVSGGGNGSPGPKVAFPGAYDAQDPGILINLNGGHPDQYPFPGPPVWEG